MPATIKVWNSFLITLLQSLWSYSSPEMVHKDGIYSHLPKKHVLFTCFLHLSGDTLHNTWVYFLKYIFTWTFLYLSVMKHQYAGLEHVPSCSRLTDVSTGLVYLSKLTKINWSESEDIFWTQLSDVDCSYKVQIVKNSKNLTHKMRIKLNMPSECKWSPHLAYKACISVFPVLMHRNEGAQHVFWILIWLYSLTPYEKKNLTIYCICRVHSFDMEILRW